MKDPDAAVVPTSPTAAPAPAPAPTPRRVAGAGGLALAVDDWGGNGPPVVLLHGGGQTRHAWGDTAERVSKAGWRAMSVDLRGHGESDWAVDGRYGIDIMADDIAALARSLPASPVLIGASLGGLISLTLAARGTQLCRALVLVDVTPRIEVVGANRIVTFMKSRPEGFASLEEAAEAVAAYTPGRAKRTGSRGIEKNLRLGADDRWHWHWDPRFLEGVGFGDGQTVSSEETPLLDRARAVTQPTLLVRGRLSDVVSDESVSEFLEAVPHAEVVDVSGAGHMVAGDRNDVFGAAIHAFLSDRVCLP